MAKHRSQINNKNHRTLHSLSKYGNILIENPKNCSTLPNAQNIYFKKATICTLKKNNKSKDFIFNSNTFNYVIHLLQCLFTLILEILNKKIIGNLKILILFYFNGVKYLK